MQQGWQLFKEAHYREAYDIFSLADAVSVGDPSARSSVKLAILCAGIAAHQYAQAMNALSWFLLRDPRTGQFPDPLFVNRLGDIRLYYGEPDGFTSHLRALQNLAIQNDAAIDLKAIYAFVLWQDRSDANARSNALFQARRIALSSDVQGPWANLYHLMEQAGAASSIQEAGQKPTSAPAGLISALPPPESPVTK